MKRKLKKLIPCLPEIVVAAACIVTYITAQASDAGIMHGTGEPDWIGWGQLGSVILLGVGYLLMKAREGANAERRR